MVIMPTFFYPLLLVISLLGSGQLMDMGRKGLGGSLLVLSIVLLCWMFFCYLEDKDLNGNKKY